MSSETLRPTGTGSINELSGGFEDVSDDSDLTYLGISSTSYATDLYTFPALSIPAFADIQSVEVRLRITNERLGEIAYAKANLYISGSEYLSSEVSQTGASYSTKTCTFSTNPAGGAWSVAAINAMEVGLDLKSSSSSPGRAARCSEVWLVVNYTLPSGSSPIMW